MDIPDGGRFARRPNVIWVFADQLRAQALGYRGDPNVRTPNIDNMARQGMRFDCAVSGAPWCAPFRASLLAATYPHQNGVTATPGRLDPALPRVTDPFKEADYHTAYVGKWHVNGSNRRDHWISPEERRGFDYWMGYEGNNSQDEVYLFGTESDTPVRIRGYETDGLTDLLISHLTDHVGGPPVRHSGPTTLDTAREYQPFFATLSVQPPHDPYVTPHTGPADRATISPGRIELRPNVPPVQWIRDKAAVDLAGYYGMIENLDDNIGKLRTALKELGIDRETYIIFFSDHGDMLGGHGQWHKSSPWEESIRIPFIVSTAGHQYNMKAGVSDALVNHVDIAPTTLGLCGLDVPNWMQGYDYSRWCTHLESPFYCGEPDSESEPQSAYLQQIPPKRIENHTVTTPWRGIVTRDGWKYVCTPGNHWLLFNLVEDPYETVNRVWDLGYETERERCQEMLQQWIDRTGDGFDLPARIGE